MEEKQFTEVDNKKDELLDVLKEVSKKPAGFSREEILSEAILKELTAIKAISNIDIFFIFSSVKTTISITYGEVETV